MDELYIMHYGVGHDEGGHSGRYPWGSGENPYQDIRARKNIYKYIKKNQIGGYLSTKHAEKLYKNKTLNDILKDDNIRKAFGDLDNANDGPDYIDNKEVRDRALKAFKRDFKREPDLTDAQDVKAFDYMMDDISTKSSSYKKEVKDFEKKHGLTYETVMKNIDEASKKAAIKFCDDMADVKVANFKYSPTYSEVLALYIKNLGYRTYGTVS